METMERDDRNPIEKDREAARSTHSRAYPPHQSGAPMFTKTDIVGLGGALVITLGPLAAYAFGGAG